MLCRREHGRWRRWRRWSNLFGSLPPLSVLNSILFGDKNTTVSDERKALIATCFRRRRAPTADATRLFGSNPQETTAQHSTAHYTRLYLQRCCISNIVLQYRLQGMGGGRGGRGGHGRGKRDIEVGSTSPYPIHPTLGLEEWKGGEGRKNNNYIKAETCITVGRSFYRCNLR